MAVTEPPMTLILVVAIAVSGLAPKNITPGMDIRAPPVDMAETNDAKKPIIKAPIIITN